MMNAPTTPDRNLEGLTMERLMVATPEPPAEPMDQSQTVAPVIPTVAERDSEIICDKRGREVYMYMPKYNYTRCTSLAHYIQHLSIYFDNVDVPGPIDMNTLATYGCRFDIRSLLISIDHMRQLGYPFLRSKRMPTLNEGTPKFK